MFDGAYPPGVYGKMLDDYFGDPAEPPEECIDCTFYEERKCGYICGVLEAEYTAEELDAMTDEEYRQKFCKEPHDGCADFERWEE